MKKLLFLSLLSIVCFAQKTQKLTDHQLLDTLQKQTLKYFWDFGHPVSGLARERSNLDFGYGHETCSIGGSGFGVMAIIAGADRGWIRRDSAAARIQKMVNFLFKAQSYHGAFPHWMNGETGKTIPFGRRDDGADLVETSYLFQGLLCAREYFNKEDAVEQDIRNKITWMWDELEFDHFTKGSVNQLYWHWSPNNGWAMNFELRGWNETLIVYILGAASNNYPIHRRYYDRCWAESSHFRNGKEFYGIPLPLGFDYGGPLFFAHYSFLGLDPRGLKDQYADYWQQNQNHTLINYQHCVQNPNHFKGYGPACWGLTASDNHEGYNAHSPSNDLGVISPTAALSSMPYTPKESMAFLRYMYEERHKEMWGPYGFYDAMNETKGYYGRSYISIDQGPVVVMVENYRSGLFWKLFMQIPEIQRGLKNLGFKTDKIK